MQDNAQMEMLQKMQQHIEQIAVVQQQQQQPSAVQASTVLAGEGASATTAESDRANSPPV